MLNSDVDFNPRLREGGDGFYWSKHCKRCLISIHASAKEATFEHLLYVLDEHIFQSTPPRRRRRYCDVPGSSYHGFQSTPPRRRRPSSHIGANCVNDFNPRLREGGDLIYGFSQDGESISIHASAKEATATYCDTSAIMYISSLNNFFVHFF